MTEIRDNVFRDNVFRKNDVVDPVTQRLADDLADKTATVTELAEKNRQLRDTNVQLLEVNKRLRDRNAALCSGMQTPPRR